MCPLSQNCPPPDTFGLRLSLYQGTVLVSMLCMVLLGPVLNSAGHAAGRTSSGSFGSCPEVSSAQ